MRGPGHPERRAGREENSHRGDVGGIAASGICVTRVPFTPLKPHCLWPVITLCYTGPLSYIPQHVVLFLDPLIHLTRNRIKIHCLEECFTLPLMISRGNTELLWLPRSVLNVAAHWCSKNRHRGYTKGPVYASVSLRAK